MSSSLSKMPPNYLLLNDMPLNTLYRFGFHYYNLITSAWDSSRFSVPVFESLIIVGTNNISEQSMMELSKKVREPEADPVLNRSNRTSSSMGPSLRPCVSLCVLGERNQCGGSGNPLGNVHKAAVLGMCVQGNV